MILARIRPGILGALALSVLLFVSAGACSPSGAVPKPSAVVEEVFTAAFETFEAKQASQTAMTSPTIAASVTPFPTFPPPSPLATISFTTPAPLTSGGGDCDDAAYIADVTVPDNTHFSPGQKFTKTWLVQNTGTCPWTTGYKLTHLDGLEMAGTEIFIPTTVPVGQQTDLSVDMRAPTSSGQFYGRWRLHNEQGQPFGSILTVVIKVDPLAETAPTP